MKPFLDQHEPLVVPAGQPKVARQFIAGFVVESEGVPEGRMIHKARHVFTRPSGTHLTTIQIPGNDLPGYCQMSLRDN